MLRVRGVVAKGGQKVEGTRFCPEADERLVTKVFWLERLVTPPLTALKAQQQVPVSVQHSARSSAKAAQGAPPKEPQRRGKLGGRRAVQRSVGLGAGSGRCLIRRPPPTGQHEAACTA
ncbi:hypothetical protein CI102_10345 [Trichoderma harzianum]|uniref:Uncharacterized protein n=1 Tax=Trichoderma harzianum CBS 226.95 TaxID=983964 RepID=A0A2T4AAZ3_TRIHA|nr:hypothetical protein M431DRAFT_449814 [Trichoderma harzianum CBS 226.95]PKK45642.1 hypothetical protein CI102_10345 [Trichoderma harzianum]PTB54088.1 hypothetical protein M431DRAFT_449814 [Trichoderma harzianum CBS 226.95]